MTKVLISAQVIDDSAPVALPTWAHVRLSSLSTQGDDTINANGDLVVASAASGIIQWQQTVQQANGKQVYFGYAWDGGPVQQSPEVVTVSGGPTTVSLRQAFNAPLGSVLTLYISSNFDNQGTFWTSGQLQILQQDVSAPTDAWYVYMSGQWKRRDGNIIPPPTAADLRSAPPGTRLDPWVRIDVPAIEPFNGETGLRPSVDS